jgi:hypothetical protein
MAYKTMPFAAASCALLIAGLMQSLDARAKPLSPATCISEDENFKQIGGSAYFVVSLKNACSKPFTCVVTANVTGSLGTNTGRAVIAVPSKGRLDQSQKNHAFKVREPSGTGMVSRHCTSR